MKRYILILVAIIALFSGCKKSYDDGSQEVRIGIEVSQSTFPEDGVVDKDPSTYTIRVTASTFWDVTTNVDFLTVTEKGNDIEIITQKNITGERRDAIITIKSRDKVLDIPLSQLSYEEYFGFNASNEVVVPSSFATDTTIQINFVVLPKIAAVTAVSSDPSWATVVSVENDVLTLKLFKNGLASARDAVITFTKDGVLMDTSLTVRQLGLFDINEQIFYASFDIDENTYVSKGGISLSGKGSDVSFVTGKKGRAYQGIGTSESYLSYLISSGSPLSSVTGFTVSMWAKNNSEGGFLPLMQWYAANDDPLWGNYTLGWETQELKSPVVVDIAANKEWLTKTPVLFTDWMHIVISYTDGCDYVMYIDGSQANISTGPKPTLNQSISNEKLYIGSWGAVKEGTTTDTWPTNANVIIDEVRIFNRGLTPDEVAILYNLDQ